MPQIVKVTYTYVVLTTEDNAPFASLEDAMHEAHDGNAVGSEVNEQIEDVPREQVEAELKTLGNDGHFFDIDFDMEDD